LQLAPKVAPLPRSEDGWCYVYFVSAGTAIKIGRALDPVTRVERLQVGHPDKLVLLAAVPAHASFEQAVHRRFAAGRLNGEWFELTADLSDFIKQLQTGVNPVALLW